MVPVPGSAEEQSWAVFGTMMVTCGWKEHTPRAVVAFCRGVSLSGKA